MDLSRVPIFVINLDRSPERWAAMREAFCVHSLVRWPGIDGGVYDSEERNGDLLPPEWGCAQSHVSLWQHIVDEGIQHAFILEDDVEPTGASLFDSMELANVFVGTAWDVLLLGENFKNCNVTDKNGDVLYCWGAHGYALTLTGAKKSIESMRTIVKPIDLQWPLAFRKTSMFDTALKIERTIDARGLKQGAIRHAPTAAKSTFTESGEKPWTDGKYKGGYK